MIIKLKYQFSLLIITSQVKITNYKIKSFKTACLFHPLAYDLPRELGCELEKVCHTLAEWNVLSMSKSRMAYNSAQVSISLLIFCLISLLLKVGHRNLIIV